MKVWMNEFPGVTLRASLPIADNEDPLSVLGHTIRAMLSFGTEFIKPLSADLTVRVGEKCDLLWGMDLNGRPAPENHSGHFFLRTDYIPVEMSPAWVSSDVETCAMITESALEDWARRAFVKCQSQSVKEEIVVWENFEFLATSVRLPLTQDGVAPPSLFVSGGNVGEGDHQYPIVSSQDGHWVCGATTAGAPIVLSSCVALGEITLTVYLRWSPWSGRANVTSDCLTLDGRGDIQTGLDRIQNMGWTVEQ